MKLSSFEAIICALLDADVRYIVAGGLAVNAHGYLRFTKDVDFIIQLVPDNINRTFAALKTLGYKPIIPISAEQFSNNKQRDSWIQDKGMQVLQFWSDQHQETPIDIFVSEPFNFEMEYKDSLIKSFDASNVRFVSIPTLITMKTVANRPQDLLDIEQLQLIMENNDKD